jgi:hypothetical protein
LTGCGYLSEVAMEEMVAATEEMVAATIEVAATVKTAVAV